MLIVDCVVVPSQRHTGIHGTTPKLPMPAGAPPHTPVVPAAILRGAGFAPASRAIGGSKTTTGLVRATGSGAGGGGPALAHAVGSAGARGAHEAQRGVLGARPVGASHRGWTPPRSLVPTPLGDMGAHGQRPPPVPYQPLGTRPLVPGGHAAATMPLSAHGIARAYDPAAMIAEQKKMEEQRRKAEEQRRMQQELDEDAVVGEAEEAVRATSYPPPCKSHSRPTTFHARRCHIHSSTWALPAGHFLDVRSVQNAAWKAAPRPCGRDVCTGVGSAA